MLGLKLRGEFLDKVMRGTQIELTTAKKDGAIEQPARDFLEITYPTADVIKAIEAIGPNHARPLVLLGERGQGKSHLIAVLHHTLKSPKEAKQWLGEWADRLGTPKVANIPLRAGMEVISEGLHRGRYKFLWDVLFDRHPEGKWARGLWEAKGAGKHNIPSDEIILELLKKGPTALVLDEFQTWFDGLKQTKQEPHQVWAFNFIQNLTSIAKNHPDLLVLVVAVRDGKTDAFQQIQRDNPVLVDFKGPNARKDRMRLLLHRLFRNRMNIASNEIERTIAPHVDEYVRLRDVQPVDQERVRAEFAEAWPFAPHLLQLLEDQVLIAVDAQETRDLIKILATLFKRSGERTPMITAADFDVEDTDSGIEALIDAVSMEQLATLREKAVRNLEAVRDAVRDHSNQLPHLNEIVSALWLRSLAVENLAGADAATLQLDVTRREKLDPNRFAVELEEIVSNSFNIHRTSSQRLLFRQEENPEARLKALARNDKLFVDGSDKKRLAKEIRYVLVGAEDMDRGVRVIVLGPNWVTNPWPDVEEADRPERWDANLPLVVLPVDPGPAAPERYRTLGRWLKENLSAKRNTVRFLLPKVEADSVYLDRQLILLARMALKGEEYGGEYVSLAKRHQAELRAVLKSRFDRFAVLREWNYADPSRCMFDVDPHKADGAKIPDEVERCIRENVFMPEEFESLVLLLAKGSESVGKLFSELQEPRANGEQCVPWLGIVQLKERLLRLCAKGKIALNVRGERWLQKDASETEDLAFKRLCTPPLGTGRALDDVTINLPQSSPGPGPIQTAEPAGGFTLVSPQPPTGGFGFMSSATYAPTDAPAQPVSPPLATGEGTVVSPPPPTTLAAGPTSGLNLMAKLEAWGIDHHPRIKSTTVKISGLSGAQLRKLLKDLPDGLKAELAVEKD